MHPQLIQTEAALRDACARWREAEALGIDTEFVRERTFYPLPALIQVADARGVALIDVPALEHLDALKAVLASAPPLKVMHALSEDLEVLAVAAGCEPDTVFDTQLAGAFAGYGYSLGYRGLVEALLSVALDKDETRSDWLRRPLSRSQLRYAALDAEYLLPMRDKLDAELDELGRYAWLEEEQQHLRRVRERDKRPELAYLRVKDRLRLSPEDHALLRTLAEWREREAMARNLPRRHVLADGVLLDVARLRPRNRETLVGIDGLSDRAAGRYGAALLSLVATAGPEFGEADAPVDLRLYAGTMKRLKRIVKGEAGKLALPPELLANRRALESLLVAALKNNHGPAPPEFLGWRQRVITGALLDCIHESRS